MKWKKYTINTTTEAEDIISSMLMDLGVCGVQIEDNVPLTETDTKGMFIDILPELPPDDGSSKVSFFLREAEETSEEGLEEGGECKAVSDKEKKACVPSKTEGEIETARDCADNEGGGEAYKKEASVDDSYTVNDRIWTEAEIKELLQKIRAELSDMASYLDIGEGSIEIGETQDTDWMNNWKQFFKPFLVDDILIKPTWESVPEEYADRDDITVIEMDPGTAFGTGSHETTQLCIRQLKKYIKGGEAVLDIGTGSGILGITALKLGAASVAATDLDDNCIDAVCENLIANMLPAQSFKLHIGNVIGDKETEDKIGYDRYDVAVANILAPVISLLATENSADRFVKKGGIFITSGIIDTKAEEVKKAFLDNPSWEIIEINTQGEWVNITARRV